VVNVTIAMWGSSPTALGSLRGTEVETGLPENADPTT
jgi:hypothetical protein